MLNGKAKQFIQCLTILTGQGFDPWGPLTQAWDESGGFTRVIGDWNFLGIKKPEKHPWTGKVFVRWTHEYMSIKEGETLEQTLSRARTNFGGDASLKDGQRNGEWYVLCTQEFVDFATCEAALMWYSDLIHRLYPNSWTGRADALQFFAGLMNGPNQYNGNKKYVADLTALCAELKQNAELKSLIL